MGTARTLDTNTGSPSFNEQMLFWASFLTLIAAGIGFTLRNALLGTWSNQFGFTQYESGLVAGFGLFGFGITIIVLSFCADLFGYAPLMVLAFLLYFSSGVVTLLATPAFQSGYGKNGAFWCLAVGGFLFSLANGTCEAVINPLTATIYSKNKTHWLNILHAGWPGGLILGGILVLLFGQIGVRWEIQMVAFLVPVLAFGLMMLGRRFPHSETRAAGIPFSVMLLEFLSPILLFLFLIHAMVGYVELGTDSWIQNITGTILSNRSFGTMLFIWTSGLMFTLRFFAGPIVHRISPLGLLFTSAVLGSLGLLMLGRAEGMWACVAAATVYGLGKTFFWPTMLGVVSERFPRGGALTLGMTGGIGMLSAGLLGGPGIGYKQDYFAVQKLEKIGPDTYERYKSADPDRFLMFPPIHGLDGEKVGVLEDPKTNLTDRLAALKERGVKDENLEKLDAWWQTEKPHQEKDKGLVTEARLYGGQMALTYTAAVPATMALCYLILIIYFRSIGGYQAQVLTGHAARDEEFTGGVEGPAEM